MLQRNSLVPMVPSISVSINASIKNEMVSGPIPSTDAGVNVDADANAD